MVILANIWGLMEVVMSSGPLLQVLLVVQVLQGEQALLAPQAKALLALLVQVLLALQALLAPQAKVLLAPQAVSHLLDQQGQFFGIMGVELLDIQILNGLKQVVEEVWAIHYMEGLIKIKYSLMMALEV